MNCHPAGDAPLQGDDSRVHAQNVKRGAEHGAVRNVDRESGDRGGGPAGDEPSEQLHVVVARAEHALVERLLGGPGCRGGGPRQGAVKWSTKLHSAQRNETRGAGYISAMASRPLERYHERTRRRGVNPFVYWPVRWVLKAAILVYFRLRRRGSTADAPAQRLHQVEMGLAGGDDA